MKSTTSPHARALATVALVVVTALCAFALLHGTGAAGNTPATGQTGTQTTQSSAKKHTTTAATKMLEEGSLALDAALIAHRVVVVVLYSPSVAVDVEAEAEAKAGAATAGAGFVAFNVFNEKQARDLAKVLGSNVDLTNPSVLFFTTGHKLAFHLEGFNDNQIVAQAARLVLQTEANRQ